MKKWVSFVMLGTMLAVGVFCVYQEVNALPVVCLMAQSQCIECGGTFVYYDCSYYNGMQYCRYICSNPLLGCWTYGSSICQGDL